MVCAKCEAKERDLGYGLACSDVWKPVGKGDDERNDASSSRKVGENKLLSSKRKMKMMPYMVPDMKAKAKAKSSDKAEGGSSSGSKTPSFAGGSVSSCKKCKSKVAKPGAKYCQSCAYKEGLCSQCGVKILQNIGQYKMSSK